MSNVIEQSFSIAVQSIFTHKLRSVLTILGITVGITAVIVVLSAGQAIEGFITSQVTQFGTDWINVEVKVPSTSHVSVENAGSMAQGVTITTLKEKDGQEIKKLPNVQNFYAGHVGQEVMTYQDKNKIGMIFGVNASFIDIDPGKVAEGRFYNDGEDKGLVKVVVLGSRLKKTLFGDEEAMGKMIKIKKQNFKVIGVMEERGSAGIFSMDDIAFVPLRTLQKLVLGIDYVSFIFVQVKDKAKTAQTVSDINYLMRDLHHITDPNQDDFSATSSDEALNILGKITGAIKILLFAIACISLVVGGVGIMNVMYVSVAERTFEIGLRKALGAKRSSILNQFLGEAVIITFLGGVIGICLGIILTLLISYIANSFGLSWGFYLSFSSVLLAVGISIFVGLVSGLYPARTAAALQPIVALRKE